MNGEQLRRRLLRLLEGLRLLGLLWEQEGGLLGRGLLLGKELGGLLLW